MRKIALKAIEDDDFRAALKVDPVKAVASMGITFTPEQLSEIENIKSSIGGSSYTKVEAVRSANLGNAQCSHAFLLG